jgi:hypothetical protein
MWRRVVTFAVLAIWTGLEVVAANPFWAMLAGGIGIYAGYVFFFAFDLHDDEPPA